MDKYSRAVKYYSDNPKKVGKDWDQAGYAQSNSHALLFGYLTSSRQPQGGPAFGCPSMVAYDSTTSAWKGFDIAEEYCAETRQLTAAVKKIPGIPDPKAIQKGKVTVENLRALAKAQRLADKMLNR